jgi:transposase-like protein
MSDKDYSLEFKLKAIGKVIFDDYSISAAAAECKVSNIKMYTWLKKHADLRVKAEQAISENKATAMNNQSFNKDSELEVGKSKQTLVN